MLNWPISGVFLCSVVTLGTFISILYNFEDTQEHIKTLKEIKKKNQNLKKNQKGI